MMMMMSDQKVGKTLPSIFGIMPFAKPKTEKDHDLMMKMKPNRLSHCWVVQRDGGVTWGGLQRVHHGSLKSPDCSEGRKMGGLR
jgi:hypothetical protein